MQNQELVQKGLVVSKGFARQQCMEYLEVTTKLYPTGLEGVENQINRTTVVLVTLVEILKQEKGSGLIAEAADVLRRLVGINVNSLKRHEL